MCRVEDRGIVPRLGMELGMGATLRSPVKVSWLYLLSLICFSSGPAAHLCRCYLSSESIKSIHSIPKEKVVG